MGHQMWQLCSAWVPALCSCWCTSARAAAVCHSLCEFVFKEAHVRSAMFVFRQRTRVTFPCGALPNLFQSYPRFYFRYRQPKKCVENQKPCSLFCHYYYFFFFELFLCCFVFPKLAKKTTNQEFESFRFVFLYLFVSNDAAVLTIPERPKCAGIRTRLSWNVAASDSRQV